MFLVSRIYFFFFWGHLFLVLSCYSHNGLRLSKNNGPTFSFSGTPTITSEKLNGKYYLAWSSSVELWFLGKGYEEHLKQSSESISAEKRDEWKKLDYQLCSLLWQSVEPTILTNFRAFKTCHSFW